jgi:hypothetical protein
LSRLLRRQIPAFAGMTGPPVVELVESAQSGDPGVEDA